MSFIFSFFEIIAFASWSKNPLNSISTGWVLFVFICSIVAAWELTTGEHLPMAYEDNSFIHQGNEIVNRTVASVTFANFNTYVTALCFAMPWLYYKLLSVSLSWINKTIIIILILFSLITITINASRGGVISMIFMAFIFMVKYKGFKSKVLISAVAVATLSYVIIQYHEEIFMVLSMRESISSEFIGGGRQDSRLVLWLVALRGVYDSFGFGVGCGGMVPYYALHKSYSDMALASHNFF